MPGRVYRAAGDKKTGLREDKGVNGRLAGKTALVVGAGSIGPGWGNGKATAVTFAREGANVVCADINPDAARETVEIILAEGGKAKAVAMDATKDDDIRRTADACIEAYGRIDVLDNNVGVAELGGVCDLTRETWDRIFAINLDSCFLAMKHVIPIMEKNGGGSIINISSVASIRYTGVPFSAYYATKAAMNHLSRTTAAQYAHKQIRVNCVLPGLMKTPTVTKLAGGADAYGAADLEEMWAKRDAQVPMGYMGTAWDVANACLFLASDESRYVTGIDLVVDGGVTLKFA